MVSPQEFFFGRLTSLPRKIYREKTWRQTCLVAVTYRSGEALRRRTAIFCILFFGACKKSMASDGTRPVDLCLMLAISEKSSTRAPVPAGSRVAFFTGLKKVTKERTILALRSASVHAGWRCFCHSWWGNLSRCCVARQPRGPYLLGAPALTFRGDRELLCGYWRGR